MNSSRGLVPAVAVFSEGRAPSKTWQRTRTKRCKSFVSVWRHLPGHPRLFLAHQDLAFLLLMLRIIVCNRTSSKKNSVEEGRAESRYLKDMQVSYGSHEPNCSLAIRGARLLAAGRSGQFGIGVQARGWFCFVCSGLLLPALTFSFSTSVPGSTPTKPILCTWIKYSSLWVLFCSETQPMRSEILILFLNLYRKTPDGSAD